MTASSMFGIRPGWVSDRVLTSESRYLHWARLVSLHYCVRESFPQNRGHASAWIDSLWSARHSFIDKPSLVLWGHKDIAFRPQKLGIWESELTNYETRNFPRCGHFLAEESPDSVSQSIAQFMLGNPTSYAGIGRKHG